MASRKPEFKVIPAVVTAVAILLILVATTHGWIALNSNTSSASISSTTSSSVVSNASAYKILKGWTIIIIDPSGAAYHQLLKIIGDAGLRVKAYRFNTLNVLPMMFNNSRSSNSSEDVNEATLRSIMRNINLTNHRLKLIVVVNLLSNGLAETLLEKSSAYVRALQHLAEIGAYVTFISNNSSLLSKLSTKFNPPLFPSPASSVTITITRTNSDGSLKVEYVAEKMLNIVGGTYIRINGRLVPQGVTSSIVYKSHANMGEALQKALKGILDVIAKMQQNPTAGAS